MSTTRLSIKGSALAPAIGPYSPAIVVSSPGQGGKMVFCSGQIALSPQTGQLTGSGDVAVQAEQVMANLTALLREAGADLSHVVKTTIFLVDMSDFATVNEIYGRSFPASPPARSTVEVKGLPRGALVEIEAIAVVPA